MRRMVWRLQQAEANFSTTAILTIYTSNHGNSSVKATSCYYDTAFCLSYTQEVQGIPLTKSDISFYAQLKWETHSHQPRFHELSVMFSIKIECFYYFMIFHYTLFLIWLITLYPMEILYGCQRIIRKINKHTQQCRSNQWMNFLGNWTNKNLQIPMNLI